MNLKPPLFSTPSIPVIQNSILQRGVVMRISRKVRIVQALLLGGLFFFSGCASPSKPQLSANAQAEALSHFSLSLLAEADGDPAAAFEHLQAALHLDPDEEKLIAGIFKKLQTEFTDLKFVVIPRHAERGNEIVKILNDQHLSFRRRSEDNGSADKNVDVLLADTTGEMLSFMDSADVVIMGKSLAGQNEGHNIIEPALLGKAIVCGNVLKNFRYILNIFKDNNALITIDCDEQLADVLKELFKDKKRREALGSKAQQVINTQQGATNNTIKSLEAIL